MTPAFNVLFLCTRNSARSIMAEAILQPIRRRPLPGLFGGFASGATAPMPEVIEKLRAVGHDISGLHSKSWDVFTGPDAPSSISSSRFATRCDGQTCPISASRR